MTINQMLALKYGQQIYIGGRHLATFVGIDKKRYLNGTNGFEPAGLALFNSGAVLPYFARDIQKTKNEIGDAHVG